MRKIKKTELEGKIKELEEQVNKLAEKYKETEDRNQLLLLYNGHITRLCIEHTRASKFVKNDFQKELSDLYLIFNVHGFTLYFDREFFKDYHPTLKEEGEFLDKWNEHVEKILNPLYKEEMGKINEKYKTKKETPNYIL